MSRPSQRAEKPADRLHVVYVPTETLIPYVRNSRTHSPAQVAQIAASIREFGFTNPILTDGDKGVIAGHGRLLAAQKLGLAEVPTIELSHLTPLQRKAYVIADNKLAEASGWDNEMLAMELGDLHSDEFPLTLTGFSVDEIEKLLHLDVPEPETEDDEAQDENKHILVVEFPDERALSDAFEEAKERGWQCKIMS